MVIYAAPRKKTTLEVAALRRLFIQSYSSAVAWSICYDRLAALSTVNKLPCRCFHGPLCSLTLPYSSLELGEYQHVVVGTSHTYKPNNNYSMIQIIIMLQNR